MLSHALALLLKIAFVNLDLFCFLINFRIIFSNSVRNTIVVLIEIILNMYNYFGRMAIFAILVFPIKELGILFPFFGIAFSLLLQCYSFHVEVFHFFGSVNSSIFHFFMLL